MAGRAKPGVRSWPTLHDGVLKRQTRVESRPLPHVTLPKGGGAIHGIGEKFSVNAVTGTSGLSLPLSLSSGRSGLTPQLQLSYDSGNGPFGFGWKLSLAAITRKTDEGLPQYRDGDGSDVFILAGAEDLVPILGSAGAARSARERSATQADSKYEPPSGAANCERSLQHLSRHRSFIPFVRRFVANRFAARWHAPERCRLPDLGGCADQGWSEAISTPAIEDRLRMRKSWRREAESNRRYRFCRPESEPSVAPHVVVADSEFLTKLHGGRTFIWPQAASGTVSLTPAQLSMLLEGIDWRRPVRTQTPQLAV